MKKQLIVFIYFCFILFQLISAQKTDEFQEHNFRNQIRSALFIPDDLPPLDVNLHGKFSPMTGVTVERITYNTLLGLRVTALIYLPDPRPVGKIPGLIIVNGHGGDKYSWYSFYSGLLFAKSGSAVLTYDVIGEGERNINRKSGTRAHDVRLEPLEMGCRMGGLMVSEVMQAVSCLYQRDEIDKNRISALGHSMGSFVLSLAGALDTRIHSVVLSGGGNLDGPDGYWDNSKPMCQGIPYRSLTFLGDRPVVIYSLHASRGPTLIYNGFQDGIISASPPGSWEFFDELYNRTAAFRGSTQGLFEYSFTEGGHRPYFVTKPVIIWLEKQLDFPNWSEEEINKMPVTHISEWAKENNVSLDPTYLNEMSHGGTMALGIGIPAPTRNDLSVFTQEEWETIKSKFIYESWVIAAKAEVMKKK